MVDFIEEYLRNTERAESPYRYLWWGAISCLSAVLRDNVWFSFPERGTRVYPNTFILLVGESSTVRKSTPFDVNKTLLTGDKGVNNTKVITGQATMQGVMKYLAMAESNKPKGGSGVILSSELASMFIVDSQLIANLTNLYEYHAVFDKHLVSYEIPDIRNVCLSSFLGSNETMMQDIINQTAKSGGLIARTIVVKESKRRHKNSGFEENEVKLEDNIWDKSVIFLKKLAAIKPGPATLDQSARRRFNEWYHDYSHEDYYTGTGFEGRLHTHIMKLCVILSAAKSDFNGTIHLTTLDYAISICHDLLPEYKKMTYGAGENINSPAIIRITNLLLESTRHTLSRRDILFKLHGHVSGQQIDLIMADMEKAGNIEPVSVNGLPAYHLTEQFRATIGLKDKVRKN
jgi:hypothetical protein